MQMFQPDLSLALEKDGEHTLNAVTLTPSSAWSAGPARIGVPPNVRITAETLGIILPLRTRRGPALQVVRPVRHRLRNLALGHGKSRVTAFVMLRDEILGSSSIDVGGATEPTPGPVVDTADWYAWVNRMPPGPASFHVTGTVYLPTPGYDAVLVPASPQGINPAELILDLVVTTRPGFWPEVITPATVRYDIADYQGPYVGVLVREPDGDAAHFAVEEVF